MRDEATPEPIPARRRRRCPNCGKPMVMRYRPFCSPRCRDLDLGRWLDGAYAVPAVEVDDDEDQPPSTSHPAED
jgi:endogenous inhibitor of DNA gyrase (YacG/DUF329 family)